MENVGWGRGVKKKRTGCQVLFEEERESGWRPWLGGGGYGRFITAVDGGSHCFVLWLMGVLGDKGTQKESRRKRGKPERGRKGGGGNFKRGRKTQPKTSCWGINKKKWPQANKGGAGDLVGGQKKPDNGSGEKKENGPDHESRGTEKKK